MLQNPSYFVRKCDLVEQNSHCFCNQHPSIIKKQVLDFIKQIWCRNMTINMITLMYLTIRKKDLSLLPCHCDFKVPMTSKLNCIYCERFILDNQNVITWSSCNMMTDSYLHSASFWYVMLTSHSPINSWRMNSSPVLCFSLVDKLPHNANFK